MALVDDVTDRAEAETQARFRAALLDSIGEAVAAADTDGRLVYINAAAERLFGWRARDVIGKDARAAPRGTGRDRQGQPDSFKAPCGQGLRGKAQVEPAQRDRVRCTSDIDTCLQ